MQRIYEEGKVFVPKNWVPTKKQRETTLKLVQELRKNVINSPLFKIRQGLYSQIENHLGKIHNTDSIKKAFLAEKEAKFENIKSGEVAPCEVCALGALYMSKILLKNKDKFNNSSYYITTPLATSDAMHDLIGKYNAVMIESAFEKQTMGTIPFPEANDYYYDLQEIRVRSSNYCNGMDDKDALKKICKNIVKNKGVFLPPNVRLHETKTKRSSV